MKTVGSVRYIGDEDIYSIVVSDDENFSFSASVFIRADIYTKVQAEAIASRIAIVFNNL